MKKWIRIRRQSVPKGYLFDWVGNDTPDGWENIGPFNPSHLIPYDDIGYLLTRVIRKL